MSDLDHFREWCIYAVDFRVYWFTELRLLQSPYGEIGNLRILSYGVIWFGCVGNSHYCFHVNYCGHSVGSQKTCCFSISPSGIAVPAVFHSGGWSTKTSSVSVVIEELSRCYHRGQFGVLHFFGHQRFWLALLSEENGINDLFCISVTTNTKFEYCCSYWPF